MFRGSQAIIRLKCICVQEIKEIYKLVFRLEISLFMFFILSYSIVQSPSWEANWFAASQEITRISRNPKVHYRTHKRLPPVSILSQPNLVHIPTSHLLEIHPNIIHPSTPRSPQWFHSFRDPIHSPLLTQHCASDKIEKNEMGWACGAYGWGDGIV